MERGKPVHPGFPEVGEGGVGNDDATKGDNEVKEEGDVERGEEIVSCEGGDGLAEADVEEFE